MWIFSSKIANFTTKLVFYHNFPPLKCSFVIPYPYSRGSIMSTIIFVYAATSPVNGFFGGALYSRLGGKQSLSRIFWMYALQYFFI